MKRGYEFFFSISVLLIVTFFACGVKAAPVFTLFYAGEEHGQFGLHGSGVEQVGGLANRCALIEHLYMKHPGAVLNVHTGNLLDAAALNAAWFYERGLSALERMKVDVLCLGPNELSLPQETLAGVHASYSEIGITCANLKRESVAPYSIQSVDSRDIAVMSLISQEHVQALPKGALISPEKALAALKSELVGKVDVIVVVFHGMEETARVLVERVAWIDVLIVAGNKRRDPFGIHSAGISTGQAVLVANVSSGGAVGVLEVSHDEALQHYIFTNAYHGVSEKIAARRICLD